MKKYYYVICGIGYIPSKFETKELAKEHADVVYYEGQKYEIVEGEEAFRAAYKAEYEKLGAAYAADVQDILDDKKWNRFIKFFTLCDWHCAKEA